MRESREIRNKRVALEAIAMLEYIATHQGGLRAEEWAAYHLAEFHKRWEGRGVRWLGTAGHVDFDEWLPADQMADYADVTATTVRSWRYRGHITSVTDYDGRTQLYNVGEVVRYQSRRVKR